jgi:hypothetical protein
MSGAALQPLSPQTARMRTLPARWNCSSGPPTFGVIIGMWPARDRRRLRRALVRNVVISVTPMSCLKQLARQIGHGAAPPNRS